MATLDQATDLADSLNYQVLSQKFADLQSSKEDAEKEKHVLHNELQRVRSELESAQARASQLQVQKQNVMIKYETCSVNERKLSDQLATLISELSSAKNCNNELVNKNSQLTKQCTDLTFQTRHLEEVNTKSTARLEHLEKRIDTLASEKGQAQQQLGESQDQLRSLRESQSQEASMAAVERFNLERECNELQSANQDLRLKLTQSQRKSEELSSENYGLNQKFNTQEEEKNRMKKEQRELRNFYEQRLSEADVERDNLRNMVEEKRRELQSNERQMRSDHGTTETSVFGRYEEEHRKAVIERDGLQALVNRLESELDEKDVKYRRLQSDNQELHTQLDALGAEAPMRTELTFAEQQAREFQEANTQLKTQLKDTTYQLRYLLREVQARDGVLPIHIQSFPDINMYADITPSLPHSKVVFKDVDQLHEQNQSLLVEVNKANKQLQQTLKDFERTKEHQRKTEAKQNKTIHEAIAKIENLSSTVHSLKSRLSQATEKYLLSEKALQENIKRTSPFINTDLQQTVDRYKQRIQQLESNNDTCYQEMQQDVRKIRQELEKAVMDASIAKNERQKSQTELLHVKQEHSRLVHALNMHSSREQELNSINDKLQQRLTENAAMQNRQSTELISIRNTAQILQQEKKQLDVQLQHTNVRIQQLLDENQKLTHGRNELNALLQSVTASKATTEGPGKLSDLLQNRIDMQKRELVLLRDKVETTNSQLQEYVQREEEYWKPQLINIEKDLVRVREERFQLENELSAAKETCQTLETKLITVEREAKDAVLLADHGDPERLHMKLSAARSEIEDLQTQVAEYETRLTTVNQEMEQAQKERQELFDDIQGRLTKSHSALQERNLRIKEMEAQVEENEGLKKEKSELEEQYQVEKKQVETLQEQQKSQEQDIQRLQTTITESTQHISELENKLVTANQAHDKDTQTIYELRANTQKITKELSESRSQVYSTMTKLKSTELGVVQEKEASEASKKSLQLSLEEARNQLASLSKVHEELLTTVSDTQKSLLSPSDHSKLIVDLSDRTINTLRKMNTSLRHENDILHSKYSEARQESERATMHLEFVRKQLDATRTELEKIRDENLRMRDDYSRSTMDAQMQASTFREDNERLQRKVTEFEGLVSTLQKDLSVREATLGPLRKRVHELEVQAKTQQDTMKIIEQTRQQWTQWTNKMLLKSNRIDPTEFQQCKNECEALTAQLQKQEVIKSRFEAEAKEAEANQAKLSSQLKEATDKVSKLQNIAASLKTKWKAAEEKVNNGVKPDTSTANAETSTDEKYQKLLAEKNQIQATLNQRTNAHTDLQKKHKDLMAKAREFIAEKKKATAEHQGCADELNKLREQLQQSTDNLNKSTENLNKLTDEKRLLEMEYSRAKVKQSVDANKITKLQSQLTESLKRSRDQEEGELSDREAKITKTQ